MTAEVQPRGRTLRRHLLFVVLSALIPLFALSVALAFLLARTDQARMEHSLQQSARLLGHALDGELERSLSALTVLANSEVLARGDLKAFYDRAARTRPAIEMWDNLLLLSPQAEHLLNLRRPYGEALPPVPQPEGTLSTARTRKPFFSDALRGRVETDWLTYMTVPVVVNDEVKYVLAATIGSAYWSRWLAERVPQGITASITGKDNNVLARTEDAQRTLGKPVSGWYLELIRAQQHGFARGSGILAADLVAAWQRSQVSGWTVNVFTSANAVDRPMRRTMVLLAAGLLATLAVVAGLTLTRGRLLTRGAERLRLALESLKGPDPAIPAPTTPVAEFNAALIAAAETAKVLESRGQALRDADRRKDEFLATLAHELRGPMAPIRNAVELLRVRPGADEIAITARDIIGRQVEHMRRLVDDLLDVARITRGAIQLLRQPVDVALIVQEALEATRPLVEKAGMRLHVTMANERLQVNADRTRLVQVLSNLLANATKFTPRGGNAWLTVRREETWASIEVRDDGAGIEASDLTHIFDMFSRPGAGSERAAEGLGIGLALVRGLVEQHGGTVLAASAGRGKGATFTVRLPLFADSEVRHTQADAAPAAVSRSCRILVADDSRDTAATLAQLLRLKGHEVLVAHDGVEALEIASREKPQVALLDLGMPRMSGYELAGRIRAEAWGSNMLLVAVSGWGQQHDRERAAKAGFDVHLTKPADPAQLDAILAGLASR